MEQVNVWWAGGDKFFNYGDALTPYLVEKISGKPPILTPKKNTKKVYLVIGSIINRQGTFPNCEVWGSGIITSSEHAKPGVKFHAVRGPLTREVLIKNGHKCPEVYGDPALLLPNYYTPKIKDKVKLGVIPHYIDYDDVKGRLKDETVKLISLTHPNIEEVTDQICSCDYIVSSSLHGVIVAQAYGIPAIWVKFSNKLSGDGIKFRDYFASVGIENYKPKEFINRSLPNGDDFIKIINDFSKHTKIISFDGDKLLNSCPFK